MDILDNESVIQLNNGGGVVSYESILSTILSVADKYEEDIKSCKQGAYKAILEEAGAVLFKRDYLRIEGKDHNAYDMELLSRLATIFCHISNRFNKYPTPTAFRLLCGIPVETLNTWQQNMNLRGVETSLLQKLREGRDEAITDKLFDSNNVTGQAMLANNILGWNTSRASNSLVTAQVDSISTLETDFLSIGLHNEKTIVQNDDNI